MRPETLLKFIKMAALGAVSIILSVLFTWLLTDLVRLYYLYSYIIVLTFITLLNFWFNTRLVFKTREKHKQRFVYYIVSLVLFYLLDIWLTRFLTEAAGFHYLISIIMSKGILFVLKFLLYDRFLFRDRSVMFIK